MQVNLRNPAMFLSDRGIIHLEPIFSFKTNFPVTAKAQSAAFIEVIKRGFQSRFEARYGSPAPEMKWTEWITLKFVLKSGGKWWKMSEDVEFLLPEPEGEEGLVSMIIVEVGRG